MMGALMMIKECYHDYPKLVEAVSIVMKRPDASIKKIVAADDFLDTHQEQGKSGFSLLIDKIHYLALFIWQSLMRSISNKYKNSFDNALKKICRTYTQMQNEETQRVHTVIWQFINASENFHKSKQQLYEWVIELNKKSDVLEKLTQEYQLKKNTGDHKVHWWQTKKTTPEFQKLELFQNLIDEVSRSVQYRLQEITYRFEQLKYTQQRSLHHLKWIANRTGKEAETLYDIERLELSELIFNAEQINLGPAKKIIEVKSPLEKMSNDIHAKAHPKLSELWQTLMQKIDAQVNWECNDKGEFVLDMPKTTKVWVASDKNRGGAVLLLGYDPENKNTGRVRGRLSKGKIEFHSGYYAHCEVPMLGIKTPKTTAMSMSGNQVVTKGTLGFGFSGSEKLPHERLKESWSKAEQVHEHHEIVLSAKISCEAGLGKNQ